MLAIHSLRQGFGWSANLLIVQITVGIAFEPPTGGLEGVCILVGMLQGSLSLSLLTKGCAFFNY